ncbi:MAG TPA: AraC family transcriptional regulator [Ruminococcaceae bacterium]|nr:AraC family transcriptional regulator [Oscillospiraceae bacterium]
MNHIEKLTAAIEYIEANLTERLDLDMVADAVHYSKHHLSRTFSKCLGLTLHDYLQRRQLTEAAKLLVFSKKSIIDISLLSGYESQQAFHCAFVFMYKLPPNAYRENEEFYPLQLKFEFEGSFEMLDKKEGGKWNISFATEYDIPYWMTLVRLAIDGFPHLHEDEHIKTLTDKIARKEALITKDGEIAVGILLFSRKTGSIDFMGTHPLYRQKGIPQAFLHKVFGELADAQEITTTTFREGDKADIGHRKQLKALGFAEAELMMEFGYPTQKFILPREANNE